MELIIGALFLAFVLLWYFLRNRYDQFLELDPTVVRIKNMLLPTFPELTNVSVMKGTGSYTYNKQKIYLCTEKNNVRYEDNMLIYVLLHELAHVVTYEFGHGFEFIENFQLLLERAHRAGLYDPENPKVENYCV